MIFFMRAGKKRKCANCGDFVKKGDPIIVVSYRVYRNSRWNTCVATCYKCVDKKMTAVNRVVWDGHLSHKTLVRYDYQVDE